MLLVPQAAVLVVRHRLKLSERSLLRLTTTRQERNPSRNSSSNCLPKPPKLRRRQPARATSVLPPLTATFLDDEAAEDNTLEDGEVGVEVEKMDSPSRRASSNTEMQASHAIATAPESKATTSSANDRLTYLIPLPLISIGGANTGP